MYVATYYRSCEDKKDHDQFNKLQFGQKAHKLITLNIIMLFTNPTRYMYNKYTVQRLSKI